MLLPTPSWTVFGARKDMAAASSSSAAPGMLRPDLVAAIFRTLDGDGDSVLSCREMFEFAQLTGYDDILSEWGAEYERLCSDYGCTGRGVDLAALTQLVNDPAGPGCQLSNTELEEVLRSLVGPAAAGRAAAQAAREAAHACRPMLAPVAKQRPRRLQNPDRAHVLAAVAKRRPCWRLVPAAKASASMCWDSRHRFASSRSPSSVHRRWGTRPGRVRKWTEDRRYLATVVTVLSGWPLQSFPEIL